MTVSASTASDSLFPANVEHLRLTSAVDVRAGTFAYQAGRRERVTGWHCHDLHQIEYAYHGGLEIQTVAAQYFLPPQKAVWIPAGLAHRATLRDVRTISIFIDPDLMPDADFRARVLSVAPIFREMIVYAARWPIDRGSNDALADSYFATLAQLVMEWLAYEVPFSIPNSSDPLVSAVMTHTNSHLEHLPIAQLCAAVGISERTLRRRFGAETGMTWRQYLLQARLIRAMALLTQGDTSVVDVAIQVGFNSASAFTRAFAQYTGETPSGYRKHALTDACGHPGLSDGRGPQSLAGTGQLSGGRDSPA